MDGKIKLTKLVLPWPALSQILLHSVLGTVYSGFALIIQNDGIGSVLLGHTAKPGRAAKGVQRLTIKSAEINYGSSLGEKNINMEKMHYLSLVKNNQLHKSETGNTLCV